MKPCRHTPPCPAADAVDHAAAKEIHRDPNVGFVLLCNGVIMFDDTGKLLPDNTAIAPHRRAAPRTLAPAGRA